MLKVVVEVLSGGKRGRNGRDGVHGRRASEKTGGKLGRAKGEGDGTRVKCSRINTKCI